MKPPKTHWDEWLVLGALSSPLLALRSADREELGLLVPPDMQDVDVGLIDALECRDAWGDPHGHRLVDARDCDPVSRF